MKAADIQLGLAGFPLGHSYSKRLHEAALRNLGMSGSYSLWEIPPGKGAADKLKTRVNAVRNGDVRGMNVTVPYKERIIPYLDALSGSAQGIGAVNTIYRDQETGQVRGENTDAPAFWADLQPLLLQEEGPGRALVLGAGGAARAVCYQLLDQGWIVLVAARRIGQARELIRDMGAEAEGKAAPLSLLDEDLPAGDALELIVNATPVGMHADVSQSPWPASWQLPVSAAVYDLVYNPALTAFRAQAMAAGLRTKNGLGMLVEQAALAFEYWLGCPVPREAMRQAVRDD